MTATAGDDATLSIDGSALAVPEFPVQQIAAWLPLSDQLIDYAGRLRVDPIDWRVHGVTGMLYDPEPWRYRDRNPMPRIVPFPRLARAQRRARAARQRAHDALDVLRHGLPETDW